MKKIILTSAVAALLLTAFLVARSQEAGKSTQNAVSPTVEYASVRFMDERTSIVWPDGKVENVMELNGNSKFDNGHEKYPKGSDYRMYWLTISMNIMAKHGFEFVFMQDHDVVMKRQIMTR